MPHLREIPSSLTAINHGWRFQAALFSSPALYGHRKGMCSQVC